MEGKLFTPNPERTFMKKVVFKLPTESGVETTATLPVTYRSLPRSELRTMQEECTDEDMYDRVVVGVDGVGDGEGNKLPPAEAKKLMVEESAFVFEACMAYQDAMLGGNLKPKTSRRQRAAG